MRSMPRETRGSLLNIPCPIPYQGSKRKLAPQILSFIPVTKGRLIEPFAGSAAISLAAEVTRKATAFVLCDILAPLMGIWKMILEEPKRLTRQYEKLWTAQLKDPAEAYCRVRSSFNKDQDPAKLLYLLARCVKNAVRFNPRGEFNQSPDHRRKGMRPAKMREEIHAAHHLLAGRTVLLAADYTVALQMAKRDDVVYMDPPYQGVSNGRDRRYAQPLDLERFVAELKKLNNRRVAYAISFDGIRGSQIYGQELPEDLNLRRVLLEAGRSSQATLLGRDEITFESLYLSPALVEWLERTAPSVVAAPQPLQVLLSD